MKLVGYRYRTAIKVTEYFRCGTIDTYGYEFYENQRMICSIRSTANPSSPTMIYGFGQEWSSEFDPDTTIFPGVARHILNNRTKKEIFKIIYEDAGQYTINIKCDSILAHMEKNTYNFFSKGAKIAVIEGIQAKCKWVPEGYYNYDSNWHFSVKLAGQMYPEQILAILAFPMLKFGLIR